MESIKAAIGDVVITFMWIFVSSLFGLFTTLIAIALGVQNHVWAMLFITTTLVFVFVFLFSLIAEFLSGASFNPTGSASFYASSRIVLELAASLALKSPSY